MSLVTDGASSMLLPGSCSWSRLWFCRRRHEEGRKGKVRLFFLLLCLSNAFTANWASSHAELPQFRLNSLHWFYDWRGRGELGDQSQNGAEKWQWQLFLQSSLIRALHMGKMRGQLPESPAPRQSGALTPLSLVGIFTLFCWLCSPLYEAAECPLELRSLPTSKLSSSACYEYLHVLCNLKSFMGNQGELPSAQLAVWPARIQARCPCAQGQSLQVRSGRGMTSCNVAERNEAGFARGGNKFY